MSRALAVAVASHKGGTGKTTTVLNLGLALARKGSKVLLVDLDSQANLTISFSKELDGWVKKDKHVGSLLKGVKTFDEVVWKAGENLWLIPSTESLGSDEEAIMGRMSRELILRKALVNCYKKYDFILFDTPPNLGLLTNCALYASDQYIVPLVVGTFGLRGLSRIIDHANQVFEDTGITLGGVILTRYNPSQRGALKKTITDVIKNKPEYKVFDTYIRDNVKVDEAQIKRQSIFEYAPESNAALDYDKLATEFRNRNGR